MDYNDPPIIKSGARHSVQIAQGTKNAKSVRNVVTSDADAPVPDRFVQVDENTVREAALLQQGLTQEQQLGQAHPQWVVEQDSEMAATHREQEAPTDMASGNAVLAEQASEHQASSVGPSVLREARAEQMGMASKAQAKAEHRIRVDTETAPADTQGVVIEGRQTQENWQRIEQLQAQANRIRIEAERSQAVAGAHASPGERGLSQYDVPPAADGIRAPEAPPATVRTPLLPVNTADEPVQVAALPPELSANLDHQSRVEDVKESALMARLRALKSNMSVAENRLTQLKPPEPPSR